MIRECTEILAKKIEQNPNFIIDNYKISDIGDYIVVKKDGTIQHICFNNNIELNQDELYKDICFYDYHSGLINMNKSQDPKKIVHSNNYMSFWVKYENVINGKLTLEVIDRYFDILTNPSKDCKKIEQPLYQLAYQKVGEINTEQLEQNREWIKSHIFNLDTLLDLQKKNYLKIFFEDDKDTYINEENRYLIPKIFTNNNYNMQLDDIIYGVPNNNIVLNPKKPYLEHKTRKVAVPYLVDIKQALLQRELFTYFLINATNKKNLIFVDEINNEFIPCKSGEMPRYKFSGLVLFVQKGLDAVIKYSNTVNYTYKLNKTFIFKQFLPDKQYKEYYNKYTNKQELLDIIDNIFFSKYLKNNLFSEIDNLSISSNIKKNLILYRDCIIDWLFNEATGNINSILHKIGINLSSQYIIDGYLQKAISVFNLTLSFQEYFGEEISEISINKHNDNITNDADYWFRVGMLIQGYSCLCLGHERISMNKLISISKPVLLTKQLDRNFIKYNYKIKSDAILQLYSQIKDYNCQSKIVNQIEVVKGYLYSYCLLKEKKIE